MRPIGTNQVQELINHSCMITAEHFDIKVAQSWSYGGGKASQKA